MGLGLKKSSALEMCISGVYISACPAMGEIGKQKDRPWRSSNTTTLPSPGLPAINGAGYAHIAFLVDDVEACLHKLLASGGRKLGEIVVQELDNVGILTVVYTRDPEGNIVEIQNWQT